MRLIRKEATSMGFDIYKDNPRDINEMFLRDLFYKLSDGLKDEGNKK